MGRDDGVVWRERIGKISMPAAADWRNNNITAFGRVFPVSMFMSSIVFCLMASVLYISRRAASPKLRVVDAVCDLGNVAVGEDPSFKFHVFNDGGSELKISKVSPSCGSCLRITGFPEDGLHPHKDGHIWGTLLTKALRGPVAKKISIMSNDPKNPRLFVEVRASIDGDASQ